MEKEEKHTRSQKEHLSFNLNLAHYDATFIMKCGER